MRSLGNTGRCGLAITALALASCGHEEHHEHEVPTFEVSRPLRTTSDVERSYVAQIRARQHIELRALERGYLEDIAVDEGQKVKKGQRMFRIRPTIYRAEYRRAKAEARFAEIEYRNTKQLADREVVSHNELALVEAKLDKAKAEAELAGAHLRLSSTEAPFNGIMDRLRVRPGSLVEEGDLLTTLSDNTEVWVYFNVSEKEYLEYRPRFDREHPAEAVLIMANGERFPHIGRLDTVEAEFDPETGNIAFRATFPNPDGLLRHGETGSVVLSSKIDDALVIPQKATFDILDRKYVFVVKDDRVEQREIEVGHESQHVYVVTKGLEETDTILLEGLRRVRSGDEVHAKLRSAQDVMASLDLAVE